jgi:hypothetical protein
MESRCSVVISSGVRKRGVEKEWWWHRESRLAAVVEGMHDRLATTSSSSHSSLEEAWVPCRRYRALLQQAHARQSMQERTCLLRAGMSCSIFGSRIIRKSGSGSLKQKRVRL